MNSVANAFVKSFAGKSPTTFVVQFIMFFSFLWILGITFMAWTSYVLIKNKTAEKNVVRNLLLVSGAFNIIMVIYILIYSIMLIKYKIGPGGIIGEYNMTLQYNKYHVGVNMWILLLLVLNCVSSGLFFACWVKYRKDNDEEALKLIKAATAIVSLIICGWIAYYVYLGIATRTYQMFDIIYQLNKSSPNIVKISNDWEKMLRRKGDEMGIDLFSEVKQVLLATE